MRASEYIRVQSPASKDKLEILKAVFIDLGLEFILPKSVDTDLPQWQKDELDKSLKEIEDGTIQSQEWSIIRDDLFKKYNIK